MVIFRIREIQVQWKSAHTLFFTYQTGQHPDCTAHAACEAGNTVRLEPRVYVPNSTTPFEGHLATPKFPRTNAYPVGSIHSIPGDPPYETCEGAKLYTYKVLHCNVTAKVEPEPTRLPISGQQSVSPAPCRPQPQTVRTLALPEPTESSSQDTLRGKSKEKSVCMSATFHEIKRANRNLCSLLKSKLAQKWSK